MSFLNLRFWFSWFDKQNSILSREEDVRYAAQIIKNSENPTDFSLGRLGESKTLFEAMPLISDLLLKAGEQCIVFGLLSKDDAVISSWKTLGINIYAIPANLEAGRVRKGKPLFKYVPVDSATVYLKKGLFDDLGISLKDGDINRIRSQLKLAGCYNWILRKKMGVAQTHSNRLQFDRPLLMDMRLSPQEKAAGLQSMCDVKRKVEAYSDNHEIFNDKNIEKGLHIPYVKSLARLDCQGARYASLLNIAPTTKSCFPFDRIVIFEDHEMMRRMVMFNFARLMDKMVRNLEDIEQGCFVLDVLASESMQCDKNDKACQTVRQRGEATAGERCTYIIEEGPGLFSFHHSHEDGTPISCVVELADPVMSSKAVALVRGNGTPIIPPQSFEEQLRTLFSFDLDVVDPECPDQWLAMHGIRPGLWFLYKCAVDSPMSPRLVTSCYYFGKKRHYVYGAGSFLFKPYALSEFATAVRCSLRHRLLWYCPQPIWEEWKYAFEQCGYTPPGYRGHPLYILQDWLAERNIQLDFTHVLPKPVKRLWDCVLIDNMPTNDQNDDNVTHPVDFEEMDSQGLPRPDDAVIDAMASVASWPYQPGLMVVVPVRADTVSPCGTFHRVNQFLPELRGSIIHKPVQVICEETTSNHPVENIADHIINFYSEQPKFNVKFMVITPLLGLVWAKANTMFRKVVLDDAQLPKSDLFVAFAPLAVMLGEIWGFSYRPSEILSNHNAQYELIKMLEVEFIRNSKRWKYYPYQEITKIVTLFVHFISALTNTPSSACLPCRTVEQWVRHVLDSDETGQQQRASFADDLVRLFGGETKFSFGSKGGWFAPSGEYVEDVPLIIEFCAKRGIIATEAIKKIVVDYLIRKGSEEAVLIQAIPIEGRIYSTVPD